MTALGASINFPNDTTNNSADSDWERDIIVCRKSRNIAVISDDKLEERCDVFVEMKMNTISDSKEVISSKNLGDLNNVIDWSDKISDHSLVGCKNTAIEPTNSNATTTNLKNSNIDDNVTFDSKDKIGDNIKPYQYTKSLKNVLDSDSEDETTFNSLVNRKICLINKESHNDDSARDKVKSAEIVGLVTSSESQDKNQNVHIQGVTSNNISNVNKFSPLLDSDSEEDTPLNRKWGNSSNDDEPKIESNVIREKGTPEIKKRTGSIRAAKSEAMREIHSETQRMLRESDVPLPYHRPKQRTLKEFLNRRKGLPTLPNTLTTAAKVKMSGKLVGLVLEKKEKEAELFYKSSSESDNEEMVISEFQISAIKPDSLVGSATENILTVEETQKVTRKESHHNISIKKIIKQGEKNLGVPRKLFISSENDAEEIQHLSQIVKNDSKVTFQQNIEFNQRSKKFNQRLKAVSAPRNLFGSEYDRPMDIGVELTDANQKSDYKPDEISDRINGQLAVANKSDQFVESETINDIVKPVTLQRNELIETEIKDFELKMSKAPVEIIIDRQAITDTAIDNMLGTEFKPITNTPFINGRELCKLKRVTEVDSEIIMAKENLASDVKATYADLHSGSGENERPLSDNIKSSCNNKDFQKNKPDFDFHESRLSKPRIFSNVMRLTPRLHGSPDMIIELSPPEIGVNKLLQRFINHSMPRKSEIDSEITAIRTEQTESGLKVTKEVLPYRRPISGENNTPELSKPGAKLIRLKEELQKQINIQRSKEWKEKELKMKTNNTYHDELSDCGMDDTENDEEEEEGEKEEEKEEKDGEENEEDRCTTEKVEMKRSNDTHLDNDDLSVRKQKNKFKYSFMDAEAPVGSKEESSDEEDSDDEVSSGEDSGAENQDDADDKNNLHKQGQNRVHEESANRVSPRCGIRKLKRIIKAFDDDDSNDSEVMEVHTDPNNRHHLKRTQTDIDIFATDTNSDDDLLNGMEGDLPVYQQRADERSQFCATPLITSNSLNIVSPTTQLTALNAGSESVNVDPKLTQNYLQLIAPCSLETTPIEAKCYRECDVEKRDKLQKKLFNDIKQTPNDMELINFCSGQFSENSINDKQLEGLVHTECRTSVSDAELLDLCSGTFSTQPLDIKKLEASSEHVQHSLLVLNNSPLLSPDESLQEQTQEPDKTLHTQEIIFSSNDEDEISNYETKNTSVRNKRRKVKILQLSDDEDQDVSDDGNLSYTNEEENDEMMVDYDSEENEITIPKKDIVKAAAGFLDEEAELSESEWGSADEDERDLDKLDLEEADMEDIDQAQVQQQLGKIHMRQVLDADKREVRLLQEILLDDGDLHSDSASRQRKFKWKNIEESEPDSQIQLDNVDEGDPLETNEAESELEWRKQRLEREQFLQEQKLKETTGNIDDHTGDSQLFQLGLRALKKTKNSKIPNKDDPKLIVTQKTETSVIRHTIADLFSSPGCGKNTFALQHAIHRGSFLARGEESLARLSLITKQNSDQGIITTKKSRNFVFTHLSPAVESSAEGDIELKNQKNTYTLDEKSRKRKPTFDQTPVASKKSKLEHDPSKTRTKLRANEY